MSNKSMVEPKWSQASVSQAVTPETKDIVVVTARKGRVYVPDFHILMRSIPFDPGFCESTLVGLIGPTKPTCYLSFTSPLPPLKL
jgi:hypothetical protein